MLTNGQRSQISLFIDGDISAQQLTQSLGEVSVDMASLLLLLLESAIATGNPEEADLAFGMLRSFSDKKQFAIPAAPLLLQLLAMDNHGWHENIIGAFRYMKDARTVEGIFDFISAIDRNPAYYPPIVCRKVAWALANVGNENAYRKLGLLAAHSNAMLASYASKRIQAWEEV